MSHASSTKPAALRLYRRPLVYKRWLHQRVQGAVAASRNQPLSPLARNDLRHRQETPSGATANAADLTAILTPLPRRAVTPLAAQQSIGVLPEPTTETIQATLLQTVRRLGVWLLLLTRFALGNLGDIMRRRDSEERRARRLRQSFERAGGTLLKIGQQLSIRLDMLPARYCQELALMLDRVPPFPTADALATIERTTGCAIADLFATFDPEPIGSASIACVYQAVLRDSGAKVAVKVRRPGIAQRFAADFRVLAWLTKFAEFVTLVRPGFTENFRNEFRSAFASELDFRREARLQELFIRYARKSGKDFFTAPQVYSQHTGRELLIMEFVSGMWLSEVLAGVEWGDASALRRMRELNIDPKTLAQRLIFVNSWGMFENLFFHADPHPANILVRANNELVFIDFGACGFMNRVQREFFAQTFAAFGRGEVGNEGRLALIAVEPLPPMDVNALVNDIQTTYQDVIVKARSKHSPWYERTTASLWLILPDILTKYNVPMPPDILMYTRSSLLYDTLAARLWPRIEYYQEQLTFGQGNRRKTRKRFRRTMRRRLHEGLTGNDFITLTQLAHTGNQLLYRLRRLFAAPYDYATSTYAIEKGAYLVVMLLRFGLRMAFFAAVAVGVVVGMHAMMGDPMPVATGVRQVLQSRWFQIGMGLLAFGHLRFILLRLGDMTKQE